MESARHVSGDRARFGLDHQDGNFNNANLGTCMDYTGAPGGGIFINAAGDQVEVWTLSNEHPDQHDYDQRLTIYAHLDGWGGGGGGGEKPCRGKKCRGNSQQDPSTPDAPQPPPPAFDMELSNSGQWGRAIAVSRDGGQSVFVQDFGNGYRVYTHVTWTPRSPRRSDGGEEGVSSRMSGRTHARRRLSLRPRRDGCHALPPYLSGADGARVAGLPSWAG